MNNTIHHGRNVKRFREMLGIKQEGLAYQLGDDWNQKKISALEQKDIIDDPLLEQVAKLLKVPAEAIKNFDEEAAIVYFNTFNDSSFSHSNGTFSAYQCTFNPLEKYIEAMEENKKLYEKLLQTEREKVTLLERLLEGKK